MSVYTEVSFSTLQDWADELRLGEVSAVIAAKHGIQNSNFFVTTRQDAIDRSFVVTVVETLPAHKVRPYLRLFDELANSGVPMPTALPHKSPRIFEIDGKAAAWFQKFEGEHPLVPTPEQIAAIGSALAKLHTRGCAMQNESLPAFINLHPQPWMKASERSWLQAKVARLQHYYQRWSQLPNGVIHSDLFRDNTLFVANDLTAVLDFYDIKYGPLLVDLATTINDWCHIPNALDGTACERIFLAAYQQHRTLSGEELRFLSWARLDAALRFWYARTYQAWLITHENPGLVGHNPEPMKRLADQIESSLSH